MSDDARATRRAAVRQMADRGMSARAIAAELGVGKDTVRRDLRDLEALARATGATAQPEDAPPAAPREPEQAGIFVPLTGAVPGAVLALRRAGLTGAEGIEWALRLAADVCRQAHTAGYPPGTPPVVTAVQLERYTAPGPLEADRSDDLDEHPEIDRV